MRDDADIEVMLPSHFPELVDATLRQAPFTPQTLRHSDSPALVRRAATHAAGHQDSSRLSVPELLAEGAVHDLRPHHIEMILGP